MVTSASMLISVEDYNKGKKDGVKAERDRTKRIIRKLKRIYDSESCTDGLRICLLNDLLSMID